MSKHSIQIKALLENKRLSRSRFNPQSSIRLIPEPGAPIRNLKRSQSSSSLKKKGNCEMLLIEDRYRKLEQNYRVVLQQTRQRTIMYAKQKQELEKCRLESEKDKKQIQRLRAMLGFTKKEDFATQCDLFTKEKTLSDKDMSKISAYSKGEQSTDAGMRQTGETWNSKERKRSAKKELRVKTPYKLMTNKSQTTIFNRSQLRESGMKSPMQRYKFVPTISFH